MSQILAFDLGGTFIKYALMDEKNAILSRGKVASPMTGLEDLLSALEGVGKEFTGQYAGVLPTPGERSSLSVSVPSPGWRRSGWGLP